MLSAYRIQRFSKVASHYSLASSVQKKMAGQLSFFFDLQKNQNLLRDFLNSKTSLKGLELGCGTGHLTEYLFQSFLKDKSIEWTISDLSQDMLDLCKTRFRKKKVEWRRISAYHISDHYDFIVSNAVVQWLDLKTHLTTVLSSLENQGFYLFSVFGQQHFQELYHLLGKLFSKNIAWKGGLSQDDIKEIASLLGFQFLAWWSETYSINYTSFWSFIQQIRKFGGSGSLNSNQMTIGKLRELEKNYQKNYSTETGIKATWQPCYVLIQKK